MAARILSAFITPSLLSLFMSMMNYTQVSERRADVGYYSFSGLFAGGMTLLLPLFVFIIFPVMLFADGYAIRGKQFKGKQDLVYAGIGAIVGTLFWLFRGDTSNVVQLVLFAAAPAIGSWVYLLIYRLLRSLFRLRV